MTTTTIHVACRHCGDSDDISTIEEILGNSGITDFYMDGDTLRYDFDGYTEMDWDSSTTVGYQCLNCGTTAMAERAHDENKIPTSEALTEALFRLVTVNREGEA